MENQFVQITSQNCHNCGAPVSVSPEIKEIKCQFCQSVMQIIRPVKINLTSSKDGDNETIQKLQNIITLIESSMIAENFNEAYDYCNKALEINADLSEVWENKAICSFWKSTVKDVAYNNAKEITTYLNKAKKCSSVSKTIEANSKIIAKELFQLCRNWYKSEQPINGDEYSLAQTEFLIKVIRLHKVCYEINPELNYLKAGINELWIPTSSSPLLLKNIIRYQKTTDRESIISEFESIIKKFDSNYEAPKQKGNCFIATATMGSYDHPEVMELRNFRDNWILEKKWGEGFVAWYYHYGSIAAKSIEKSFVLKKICYLLIVKPLVYLSRIVKFKQ